MKIKLFFCLLLHRLAVRISLPFHTFLNQNTRNQGWSRAKLFPSPGGRGRGGGAKAYGKLQVYCQSSLIVTALPCFYTLTVTARNKTKAKTKTKKQKLRWLALACMAVSNKENFTEGTMSDTAANDRCFCCVKFKCPLQTLLNLILWSDFFYQILLGHCTL